jgi:hypothetical protein
MLVILWVSLTMLIINWLTMPKIYKSYNWLYKRYVVEKKTIEEMALEANTSHQTIYRYLTEAGLIKNQRKWS